MMHNDLFKQIKERGPDGLQERLNYLMRELRQPFYHDVDSVMNNPGWPDVCTPVLVAPDRAVLYFPELKMATGRVSAEQQAWLDVLALCQEVKPFVLRPDGYDGFRSILYESFELRMAAGFTDPVTKLYDVMREKKTERRVKAKAKRTGQVPMRFRGKGRTR